MFCRLTGDCCACGVGFIVCDVNVCFGTTLSATTVRKASCPSAGGSTKNRPVQQIYNPLKQLNVNQLQNMRNSSSPTMLVIKVCKCCLQYNYFVVLFFTMVYITIYANCVGYFTAIIRSWSQLRRSHIKRVYCSPQCESCAKSN